MNSGSYVFKQVIDLFPKYQFDKLVKKYNGHYKVKSFSCWSQFLCLCFGQLTHRESLRDIVACLQSHSSKLYHLGIRKGVARSTLGDANEKRDWKIYAEFAELMIVKALKLYEDDDLLGVDLNNTVYALDSTTIDLCLAVYPWTPSSKNRAALKLHTLMNLQGSIPVWIRFSDGLTNDMTVMDELIFEPLSFYIMDRGYMKLEQLNRINLSKSYFVIRAKKSLSFCKSYSNSTEGQDSIIYDQVGHFKGLRSNKLFPGRIRRIKTKDEVTKKTIVLLTNNLEVQSHIVASLYKSRWQIELFFKWIKQHLKIKKFWGYSSNAVKIQIWTAITVYILVAILKKKLNTSCSIYEILQILSVSVFDKTPVNQLINKFEKEHNNCSNPNQLIFNW